MEDVNLDAPALDAWSLRGLAHPLRMRLLGLLRADGPSTATRLAARLGINSGATSYHLRQLATYGFVAEDASRAGGRERWWRSVHRVTHVDTEALGPEADDVAEAFLRGVTDVHAERSRRAADAWATLPDRWRHATDFSDFGLRLTPEESKVLRDEIFAVIGRYRRDEPGAEGPPGSASVAVIVHLFPRAETVPSDPGEEAAP